MISRPIGRVLLSTAVLLLGIACGGADGGGDEANAAPRGVSDSVDELVDDAADAEVDAAWTPKRDACSLLTIDEISMLAPNVVEPGGEDDFGSPTLRQCTYEGAFILQYSAAARPETVSAGARDFGIAVAPLDDVGEWGLLFTDEEDGWMSHVAASNGRSVVSLIAWDAVRPNTPEFDTLVDLLERALVNA